MNNFDLKREIAKSDTLRIFIITIFIMSIWVMAKVYFQMNGETEGWFITQTFPWMAISKSWLTTLQHPWVLVTHCFVDASISSLIGTFIWLYFFSFIIEDVKGAYSVLPLFLFTAIVTGIVTCVLCAANPRTFQFEFFYGMRPSLLAITTAAVLYNPTYKVFTMLNGGFSVWIVGVLCLLINISMGGNMDLVTLVAIFLGIIIGALYNNVLASFFSSLQHVFANGITDFKFRKKQTKILPITKAPHTIVNVSQKKIDELLDKINDKGIDSLTEQEKKWLQANS
jgi:membrane associated rhomboid family serine protease